MNAVNAPRAVTNYYYEYDHGESFTRVTSAITLFDPIRMTVGYMIPWLAAWASGQTELRRDDPAQERLLNSEAKDALFQMIDELKAAADIDREISLYTSLNYNCSSYGGGYSLSCPVISIPLFFLTKKGESLFENEVENPTDQPPDYWSFSEDEITFFIAREMAHIKSNDSILHLASKIFFLSAIFFFFTLTAPLFVSGSIILGTGILYLLTERFLNAKLDVEAVRILTKYFDGDQERALRSAKGVMQKLINQNIERKERESCCTAFYLTKAGNNLLDLDYPLLTTRLEKLQDLG